MSNPVLAKPESESPNFCPVCLEVCCDACKLSGCSHVVCGFCVEKLCKVEHRVCPLCRAPAFWVVQWDNPELVMVLLPEAPAELLKELSKPEHEASVVVHCEVALLAKKNWIWTGELKAQSWFVEFLAALATRHPTAAQQWMETLCVLMGWLDKTVSLQWTQATLAVVEAASGSGQSLVVMDLFRDTVSRLWALSGNGGAVKLDFGRVLRVCEACSDVRVLVIALECFSLCHKFFEKTAELLATLMTLVQANAVFFEATSLHLKALNKFTGDAWTEAKIAVALQLCTTQLSKTGDVHRVAKLVFVLSQAPTARKALRAWFMGPCGEQLVWGTSNESRNLAFCALENLFEVNGELEFFRVLTKWALVELAGKAGLVCCTPKKVLFLSSLLGVPNPGLRGMLSDPEYVARAAPLLAASMRKWPKLWASTLCCIDGMLDLGVAIEVQRTFAGLGVQAAAAGDANPEVVLSVAAKLVGFEVFRVAMVDGWNCCFGVVAGTPAEKLQNYAVAISKVVCVTLEHEHGNALTVQLCVNLFGALTTKCPRSLLEKWSEAELGALVDMAVACLDAGVAGVVPKLLEVVGEFADVLSNVSLEKVALLFEVVNQRTLQPPEWVLNKFDLVQRVMQLRGTDEFGEVAVAVAADLLERAVDPDTTFSVESIHKWLFVDPSFRFWEYLSRVLSQERDCDVRRVVDVARFLQRAVARFWSEAQIVSAAGALWGVFVTWMGFEEVVVHVAAALSASVVNLVPSVRINVSSVLDALHAHLHNATCVHRCVDLLDAWAIVKGIAAEEQEAVKRDVWDALNGLVVSPAVDACLSVLRRLEGGTSSEPVEPATKRVKCAGGGSSDDCETL